MKKKILHILHGLNVGGLENGVVNLINRLDPEGFEHEICCITSNGPMAERFVQPVRVHEMGKGAGRTLGLPLRLAGLIRKVRPDIVHTRNWGTIDGIIGARLAGVRRIVHGEHGREATDPTGANRRRQIARRLLAPAVTRFVTVSAELDNWLVRDIGVPRAKVEQIINGVDGETFRPEVDKAACRTRLGIPDDKLIVGIVGRLDPVKDHATLLRAVAQSETACRLVVVGAGPAEDALRQLAAELNVAEFTHFFGARHDIAQVLGALDVFVLPSLAEGISNTILEAMACGLPVIASRVGGNPELVTAGETGFLFDVGQADMLAAQLKCYIERPELRRAHGVAARERVEREFSLAAMVSKYERMYRALITL